MMVGVRRILIIGGNGFLGRHLARAFAAKGDRVTLFNRGSRAFDDGAAETVHGDRRRDLDKLDGRTWDAVVDTCGYFPENVAIAARYFASRAARYIFISSISAYAGFAEGNNEESPTAVLTSDEELRLKSFDAASEDFDSRSLGDLYGPLKALCEREVAQVFGERATIVRPGLIAGEFDPTDRFTYWVMRVARGGRILVPLESEAAVQLIDASDLACWLASAEDMSGVFNATGRPFELTFGALLARIRATCASDCEFVAASPEFRAANEISHWTDLPLFIPPVRRELAGFFASDVSKANGAGLVTRPLEQTIESVLSWRGTVPSPLITGLEENRERELLERF